MSNSLPWEMVVEIMSRLPVKSLMRSKCVSKSFYRLISHDAVFKKKHLHQSNFERAIVCYKWRTDSVISCHPSSLASDDGTTNEDVVRIDVPQGHFYGSFYWERSISNSCDGLFCIEIGSGLFIWNPHTRESKEIPNHNLHHERVTLGLVYDSVSDDYKVIAVAQEYGHSDFHQFSIFSLKTCSPWRNIKDDFPCKYLDLEGKENNIVVNGAFHWIAYDDRASPYVLISLDVANEKFNKFALPSPLACRHDLYFQRPVLCVLREKLCMFEWSCFSFDLWMMEEYGVVQSLRKILSGNVNVSYSNRFIFSDCRPMYMFEDDTITMYDCNREEEQISVYKDERLVRRDNIAGYDVVCAYISKETIISPHMSSN